jgi:16S rRNA (adenine1518-N6/adenine1519-N6)-dimethyltransferase
VAALGIVSGDHVLEIGPGTGVLTSRLAASLASRVVAVDIDPRAVEHVRAAAWAAGGRVEAMLVDVLQVSLAELFPGVPTKHIKVIGNIPYAITSDIMFWAFHQRQIHSRCVLMMQREVALRCIASPRTKDYGILTVAAWYASTAKLLFNVKPGSFFPAPSVTSSVVRFDMRQVDPLPLDMMSFMAFVRAAFSQRRKVLANALQGYVRTTWNQNLRDVLGPAMSIDLQKARAEELTPEQLYNVWEVLATRSTSP